MEGNCDKCKQKKLKENKIHRKGHITNNQFPTKIIRSSATSKWKNINWRTVDKKS